MEEDIKEISRRLAKLEQHVINLIIPIQGIVECLKSPNDIKYLIQQLQKPVLIDYGPLKMILIEFERNMKEFSKDIEKFEGLNAIQTSGEIKYIGKRINEIESTLKKMQSEGIKKNIELEFRCDGYEMVKKPLNYDKKEPIEEPDQDLKNLLETLAKRESFVLVHRFGLLGQKCTTLEKTGKLMGLSRERVRAIEAKALRKLRHPERRSLAEKIKDTKLRKKIFGEELE